VRLDEPPHRAVEQAPVREPEFGLDGAAHLTVEPLDGREVGLDRKDLAHHEVGPADLLDRDPQLLLGAEDERHPAVVDQFVREHVGGDLPPQRMLRDPVPEPFGEHGREVVREQPARGPRVVRQVAGQQRVRQRDLGVRHQHGQFR
jgi:hypothetical protein